jgi:hypothetical protein
MAGNSLTLAGTRLAGRQESLCHLVLALAFLAEADRFSASCRDPLAAGGVPFLREGPARLAEDPRAAEDPTDDTLAGGPSLTRGVPSLLSLARRQFVCPFPAHPLHRHPFGPKQQESIQRQLPARGP